MNNTQVVTFDNYAPSNCRLSVPIPNTVDSKSKNRSFGKVQTIPVWLEGIDNNGDYFKEPFYLGVSKTRLFYIKLWGINSKDILLKELDKDIDSILNNLSYREANNNLR